MDRNARLAYPGESSSIVSSSNENDIMGKTTINDDDVDEQHNTHQHSQMNTTTRHCIENKQGILTYIADQTI